ncbi:Cip2 [Colletotrichum truncatum]|uniref:Cip2 n=1 Tax=Colletotrichum truncatum TaxID=5467 RepID=A0ACC3YUJ3_COLTU|nr:Cip2 [Colletotrichum truncatum]KAF6781077.1 Cip2 [Colletotrichum truncatum]
MKYSGTYLAALVSLASRSVAVSSAIQNSTVECAPLPSAWPTWQQLPKQPSLPDPFLPLKYMTLDNASSNPSQFATEIMTGKGKNRIKTTEEWYQCQRPQFLTMLQEYQFGYYPDRSQEKVEATRSGNTLTIAVTSGGKTGRFQASLSLPAGKGPFPVVINIGGMQDQPYLQSGIAIARFNYANVAADSASKTGAFWDIYRGRDIGVLTAWAWGFHRTLDALILVAPEIDGSRVGVTGCSRLGKAALAAGLFDERITLTMPMSSGVQGLGPYRYYGLSGQGENLENSKQGAGWWTNNKLGTFVGHSENLPFDAHTIAAAIAPRALVIDQGTGDPFVNSKGTSVVVFPAAKAVYDFLGVGKKIGIAVRGGGHCDMSGYSNVLPFVQEVLQGKSTMKDFHSLGTYGSPMASAYPWATAIPKL